MLLISSRPFTLQYSLVLPVASSYEARERGKAGIRLIEMDFQNFHADQVR